MSRVRRLIGFLLGVLGGLAATALLARALIPSRGDEASDELALVAIGQALALRSHAGAFRGGSLRSWMSGVELDLGEAHLDPAGADLELTAVASGVEVRLPPAWRVVVHDRGRMRGLAVRLPGQEQLDPGAPTLTVRVLAVGSGVEITSRPARPAAR